MTFCALFLVSITLLVIGLNAIEVSKIIPTPRTNEPFLIGPLEFFSDLAVNGKFVQITIKLNSVLVAATVLDSEKSDYSYDVIVGTAKSQGTLHAQFDHLANATAAITATVKLQVASQSDNTFTGDIFKWISPEKPFPARPIVAPTMPKPYFIENSLSVNADLQKDDILHVVITSGALPMAAVTLSTKFKEHRFDLIVGSLTTSGTITHLHDKDGISTLWVDMLFQQAHQQQVAFRGAVFFWTKSSVTTELTLPTSQPFYLGTTTQVVCGLRQVDGVSVIDSQIVIGQLLAATSGLTAIQPSWWYDVLIGLTATNGTLVANFAPQGEISSVMGDLMLYESGQQPQPFRGGVFFWMK